MNVQTPWYSDSYVRARVSEDGKFLTIIESHPDRPHEMATFGITLTDSLKASLTEIVRGWVGAGWGRAECQQCDWVGTTRCDWAEAFHDLARHNHKTGHGKPRVMNPPALTLFDCEG